METYVDKPSIWFYAKSGVLYTILPYLGSYETWKLIMTLICKESKQIWDTSQTALKELDKLKTGTHSDKLEILYKKHCGEAIEFDEKLKLQLEIGKQGHIEFMKAASKLRFINFSELHINHLWYKEDDQKQQVMDEFLDNLDSVSIQSILLICTMSLNLYCSIPVKIPAVTERLEIQCLRIHNHTMANILQYYNWEQLILMNVIYE